MGFLDDEDLGRWLTSLNWTCTLSFGPSPFWFVTSASCNTWLIHVNRKVFVDSK